MKMDNHETNKNPSVLFWKKKRQLVYNYPIPPTLVKLFLSTFQSVWIQSFPSSALVV